MYLANARSKFIEFFNFLFDEKSNRKIASSCLLASIFLGQVLPLLFDSLPTVSVLAYAVISCFVLLLLSNARLKNISILVICIMLGFTWSNQNFRAHKASIIAPALEGQTITVSGVIDSLPISKPNKTSFVFRLTNVQNNASELDLKPMHDRLVRLTCYYCFKKFSVGQTWQFQVRLKRPHRYASWGAFDYEKYLFRQQVIANGYIRDAEQSKLLDESDNNLLTRVRLKLGRYLRAELSEGAGQHILLALTVGDKSEMSTTERDLLQKLGLSHLVAISGLHIGILFWFSGWLFGLLSKCCPNIYLWRPRQMIVLFPALAAATCYAALAGFAISTQRALIMLIIYTACRFLRLDVSLLRVLLITAVTVLFYDPFSILDAGFWLSFNAVLIIAIVNSRTALSLWYLQPILWFGMLPISILLFSQASLASPFVNLLMVPIFSLFIIPAALLSILVWTIYPAMASWLLKQLAGLLDWLILCLQYLASIENIMVPLAQPALLTWVLYGLLLLSCYYRTTGRAFVLIAMLASIILNKPYSALQSGEYRLTLLDVGQGLSLLIETKNETLLYDTGPAYGSGSSAAESVVLPYLKYRQINHIDRLLISHADNDHIGGLDQVLNKYTPQVILTSRPDKVKGGKPCYAGQSWQDGLIRFTVLSPDENTPAGSNNRSCVVKLEGPYGSILITGDIEAAVERYLLTTDENLSADIMLVPHQGSKTSSTQAFLTSVNPGIGLIAAGYRNHYGHPYSKVVERYMRHDVDLLSTINLGSIMIKSTDQGWKVTTFRESESGFWSIKK